MSSGNYFDLLPTELIERILLQFTRPSDLLSLALTKGRFSSIIIPDILEHCYLRFSMYQADVWEYLERRPLACSRVTNLNLSLKRRVHQPIPPWLHLQLIKENTVLPRFLKSNISNCLTHELKIDTICNALANMSNLKQIAFDGNSYNSGSNGDPVSLQQLFTIALGVLNSKCELENVELDLTFPTPWTAPHISLTKMLSDINWTSSIKTCHLSLTFLDKSYHSLTFKQSFRAALHSLANLTHLQLILYDAPPLLHIDKTDYWPKLEYLYIKESREKSRVQYFVPEFIPAHPRLHTLYLEGVTFYLRSLSIEDQFKDAVPSLNFLALATNHYPCDKFPTFTLKNLTHFTLSHHCFFPFPWLDQLESLESCTVSMTTVNICPEELKQGVELLLRGCKKLKKLCFEVNDGCPIALPMNDPICELFQKFLNLTHLLGISCTRMQLASPEGDALLKRLYQFPQLRYIGCYGDDYERRFTCVELRRNDVLQQMGYTLLDHESIPESCDHRRWGNFAIRT